MNKVLLISPHFDDAVLSAGQLMAERPDCVVVTVFGGFPENPESVSTPYDQSCGFNNAQDAVSVRRHENNSATALLKASAIDLDFPDGQYGYHVTEDQIAQVLQRIVDNGDYEAVYAPIGLGHPDHVKVSNAAMKLRHIRVILWEDSPIRITEPELVPTRLEEIGLEYSPNRTIFNRVQIADKVRALLCYSSQVGTGILDPYLMYLPERFYDYN